MTSDEVIKLLQKDGWTVKRQSGSHVQLQKEGNPNVITVPHPRKDLSRYVLNDVMRKAGWK